MAHWLLKSEPDVYGWDDLLAEGEGIWDGVRNYQARNNLAAMALGEQCFFYHSRSGLAIVGIVEVSQTSFRDPTSEDDRWVAVKVKPLEKLARSVTLAAIKAEPALAAMMLVKNSRLSVSPVTEEEWSAVLAMAAD
jgi:predicted RNA-binding protein with PUA-like domain